MRKPILCLLICLLILFAIQGMASQSISGGITLGEPTGFRLVFPFQWNLGMDVGAGWSFSANQIKLYGDILFLNAILFEVNRQPFHTHVGLGVGWGMSGSSISIRVPFIFDFPVQRQRLTIFLEIAPEIKLDPFGLGVPSASIGVRYHF